MRRRLFCAFGIACLLFLPEGPRSFGQDGPKQEAERLFESAKKLAGEKKFDEAANIMKQALRLAPKNDLYLALTANFEREAGRFAEGLAHAQEAIKINDKVGDYYVVAAANAYEAQDIARARAYVQTVLKGGPMTFGPGPVLVARNLEGLLVKKTYTLFWDLKPKRGLITAGAFQVALPKSDLPYQSLKYKVSGARSSRLVKGEANDVLLLVPEGTKSIQLTMEITTQPYSYKDRLAERKTGPVPAATRYFLGPSEGIDPRSPKLAKVVAGLKTPDSAETVKNIAAWMKKNIEYKLESKFIDKPDFKTADEVLDRKYAECRGYAVLFAALCRAAGVPTRPVWGFVMRPPSQGGGFGSHNWVEVYLNGVGWVPMDAQLPETLGYLPTTHLRFFMDMKRSARSTEVLPIHNLMYMNGNDLRYETRVEPDGTSPGTSKGP